jgi:peptide/nickel transport system permease protein
MVLINLWKESGKFKLGMLITLFLLVAALLHNLLLRWAVGPDVDPMAAGSFGIFLDPQRDHLLGTDRFGRDVFSLVVIALPVSLTVAFLAGAISTAIGVVMGFFSGFIGGLTDSILRTFTDMFIVIPTLPLIIILAANTYNLGSVKLALFLAAFSWPAAARVIRSQVLSLRERPYIELSRMTNLSNREIIVGDILPNMAPYVAIGFAQASVGSAFALVGLTVLGIGPSSQMDLGRIISEALGYGVISLGKEWIFIAPVALLILLFLGLALISQGMEEFFNPRLRSQS